MEALAVVLPTPPLPEVIEMIEAVGHQYLDTFFQKCGSLLKPDGEMLIQAITIADQRYESEQDLLLYCYHVAGVVGVMMAMVMVIGFLGFLVCHNSRHGIHSPVNDAGVKLVKSGSR